jgi:hypothetical protein
MVRFSTIVLSEPLSHVASEPGVVERRIRVVLENINESIFPKHEDLRMQGPDPTRNSYF